MSGLRECPSCAGTDISAHRHKDDFENWRFDVSCSVCGMGVGFSEDANPWDTEAQLQARRDECVATWNRRAPDPLFGQLVEALEGRERDIGILIAQIRAMEEYTEESLEAEDAALVFQIENDDSARTALSAAAAAKEGRS